MSTTTYRVTGMTCGHCAASVRNEVCAIEGVTDCQVELTTGAVTVTSSQPVAYDALVAAIDEAGYQLAS
jgi:copper chaperone